MTINYGLLTSNLEANNYSALAQEVIASDLDDMIEIALILGPYRLRELSYRLDSRFSGRSPFTSPMTFGQASFQTSVTTPMTRFSTTINQPNKTTNSALYWLSQEYSANMMREMMLVAFGDRIQTGTAGTTNLVDRSVIRQRFAKISVRSADDKTVRLLRDATKWLPKPPGPPPLLAESDYVALATRQAIDIKLIKAVAEVETGRLGSFDEQNRPKILFEGHLFRKYTKNAYDLSHPHLSKEYPASRAFYKMDQYGRLFEAMLLDVVAACSSASWGKFQVMGFNHSGWKDVMSFAVAMFESEQNHLKAFEAYCVDHGVFPKLKRKDWAATAKAYNGKDYEAGHYDTKLQAAYTRLGGT